MCVKTNFLEKSTDALKVSIKYTRERTPDTLANYARDLGKYCARLQGPAKVCSYTFISETLFVSSHFYNIDNPRAAKYLFVYVYTQMLSLHIDTWN